MIFPIDNAAVGAFTEEFRESVPAILAALDAAAAAPADRRAAREAHRLIHALKGAASMVGLAALGYLLHAAEELIDRSISEAAPLSGDVLDQLRGSTVQFAGYMDAALAGRPVEPLALDLLRQLGHDHGAEATAELRALIEIEAREIAVPPPVTTAAPLDQLETPAIMLPPPPVAAAGVAPPLAAPAPLEAEPAVEIGSTAEIDPELA